MKTNSCLTDRERGSGSIKTADIWDGTNISWKKNTSIALCGFSTNTKYKYYLYNAQVQGFREELRSNQQRRCLSTLRLRVLFLHSQKKHLETITKEIRT